MTKSATVALLEREIGKPFAEITWADIDAWLDRSNQEIADARVRQAEARAELRRRQQ